ncbi:lysophospholipase [Vibrio maritimus]|uniref:Lysophospholipase n=1 Tax=Vibrio maritimus TaxID=990268 RepID=A0A090TBQ9_9VIBR|nr:lysophospholipase [Vibrio maritimus]
MKKFRPSESKREKLSRHKRKLVALAFYLSAFITAGIIGCSTKNENPSFAHAPSLPSYQQSTYQDYVDETQQWLAEHRVYKTDEHDLEVALNSPFEVVPEDPNGEAVLLVHGLGDSPYSFRDIANHLAKQGYLVRAILLPGHGSKVGDLILPSYEDWHGVVEHHTALLLEEYPSIWLGGYSTGANLVTSKALLDDRISGLLLFSPAFKPTSNAVKYASFASVFVQWADKDPEDNMLRYNSLPMNGAAVYYETVSDVQTQLDKYRFDKPTVMVLSEGDSVVDTKAAVDWFNSHFSNPNNKLVWQGDNAPQASGAIAQTMRLPEFRVSNGSHMGMLFSPENPYYGTEGSVRICDNGQAEEAYMACLNGEPMWYSSYGYQEPGKIHARLTFNPYFDQMSEIIDSVMNGERHYEQTASAKK